MKPLRESGLVGGAGASFFLPEAAGKVDKAQGGAGEEQPVSVDQIEGTHQGVLPQGTGQEPAVIQGVFGGRPGDYGDSKAAGYALDEG